MFDHAALHEPHAGLLRAALELASPRGAAAAVDLACGAGAKTAWLAALCAPGALVVGVDAERGALRTAPAGVWVAGDAHALPLRSASCDLIWCVAALGLFADPARALAEARRALRPGGALVLAVAGERWVRLRAAAPPLAAPPPADGLGDELRDALEAAGLRAGPLAAYLLDPPGLAPLDAAFPLAELDGASPGEPEPRPVLLVAVGRVPGA
jgi:SAM-dependent methyltransferase